MALKLIHALLALMLVPQCGSNIERLVKWLNMQKSLAVS